MERRWQQLRSPYGALPDEIEMNEGHPYDSGKARVNVDSAFTGFGHYSRPSPQLIENSWLKRLLRLIFDLVIAGIALLFVIFGLLVLKVDGHPAVRESTGLKLLDIAQYAPTVFPVVFAAIVGASMKAIASWRVQTSRGASIGLVEQCLGSQTITRAFTTQWRLRSLSFLGITTVFLWCLSPIGSQAALRVISIVPKYTSTNVMLSSLLTSTPYMYGFAEGIGEANTTVANPLVASMLAASLLQTRNQDLWGNVRFPAIEQFPDQNGTNWIDISMNGTNITYPSLVGTPLAFLPSQGNTSVSVPGSYISISCPVFRTVNQSTITNLTSSSSLAPNNGADCSWRSFGGTGVNMYQIALSIPGTCGPRFDNLTASMNNGGTRPGLRKLFWESRSLADMKSWTQAQCELTTSYVDVNVTCNGGWSGSSTDSTCRAMSVRRSPTPRYDSSWTVLDMQGFNDASAILQMLAGTFPNAVQSGGTQPVVQYLEHPANAVTGIYGDQSSSDSPLILVGVSNFQYRLAQLLNTILFVGISPRDFTGGFNATPAAGQNLSTPTYLLSRLPVNLTAINTVESPSIHCNRGWLSVLIVASLAIFICAMIGATLRFLTLAPGLLGSSFLPFLPNKIESGLGSTAWSADTWARNMENTRIMLGDVDPGAEIGQIGLATVSPGKNIQPVRSDRYYY